MTAASTRFEVISKTVQIVSVVAGVVLSVLSFNSTRVREAEELKQKQVRQRHLFFLADDNYDSPWGMIPSV
jgi:hypothetical protein